MHAGLGYARVSTRTRPKDMVYVAGDHTQHALPTQPLQPARPVQENKDANLGIMQSTVAVDHVISPIQ